MDRSSNPAERSGSRYCLRKCSRSLIAAAICNSSLDFSSDAEAWSISRTCRVCFSSAEVIGRKSAEKVIRSKSTFGISLLPCPVTHPEATFYERVRGCSMNDAGIQDGDLLVIDEALYAYFGNFEHPDIHHSICKLILINCSN